MNWHVRRATAADSAAIRAVADAAWRSTYAGHLRAETIDAFLAGPYSDANVLKRIHDDAVLVAEADTTVIAYADAIVEAERILLAAIYALPDRQGSGVGTALLVAAAALRPDLPLDAFVLLGNRSGERFYERRGFRPIESVATELFGEDVIERRWRRPAAREDPPVDGA